MRHLALAYPGRPARDGPRGRVPARPRPAGRAGRRSPDERERDALPAGRALDRLVAVDHARRARRAAARRAADPDGGARRDAAGAARRAAAARARGRGDPAARPVRRDARRLRRGDARCACATGSDRLRLLAWPRGRTTASLGVAGAGERVLSTETADGWKLEIQGTPAGARTRSRRHSDRCAAARSARARSCNDARGPTPVEEWSYDGATGVLTMRLDARNARVVVRRSC